MAREIDQNIDRIIRHRLREFKQEISQQADGQTGRMNELSDQLCHLAETSDEMTAGQLGHPLLSQFSGRLDESFADWLEKFELNANGFGWSPEKRAKKLPTFLDDNALEQYKELSDEQKADYNILTAQLRQRLTKPENHRFSSLKLKARQKLPTESIADYAGIVKKLARAAYPADLGDRYCDFLTMESFISGLPVSIKKAVMHKEPANFKAAVETAQKEAQLQYLNLSFDPLQQNTENNKKLCDAVSGLTDLLKTKADMDVSHNAHVAAVRSQYASDRGRNAHSRRPK